MGKRLNVVLCTFLFCINSTNAKDVRTLFDSREPGNINGFLWLPQVPRQDPLLISMLRDIVLINRNLFSWRTYAVFTTTFPLYVVGRMFDEKFHNCFYDAGRHRNINQLPHWAVTASDGLIFAPLAILGSLTFFSHNDERRLASRVFLEGIPFVWATKDIIKASRTVVNIRPKNEHFSKNKRSYGGFPSGHMAASMYMTIFYGLREGHRFAIPLGIGSLFLGATLLDCNRHYFSQIIAGAALGAMYAFAASSVVDYNRERDLKFGISLDSHGAPSATVSWLF